MANIIEYFLQQNPKAILFFTGTTKQLTNSYKERLLKEMNLSLEYDVEGVIKDNVCEPIVADKDYEGNFIFYKKIALCRERERKSRGKDDTNKNGSCH